MGDQDTMMLALSVEPMGGGDWRWCWYDHNSGKALADGVKRSERAAWTEATSHFVQNSDVFVRGIVARAEAAEQRAEALAAEVARLRTDALLLAGLANHRAVYEMDGHDAEALDVAAERADEAADGVVIDVIRRALWGVAEAQPAEVADV